MNREMEGQLAIRDETGSTSNAVAGPDQVITLPMESALLMATGLTPNGKISAALEKFWSCFFQAVPGSSL
jgi:hypothetical protein